MGPRDQSPFRNSAAVRASQASGHRLFFPNRAHGVVLERSGLGSCGCWVPIHLASWPPPRPALRFPQERQSVCETEKPEASQRVRQILFWLLAQVQLGPRPSYTCQGPGVTRMSGWEEVQACSDLVLGE